MVVGRVVERRPGWVLECPRSFGEVHKALSGQVTKVEVDLRVGGHYLILFRGGDTEYPLTGTYLEIDEPARLVYTFKWERELPFPDGPYTKQSRVTVEFKDIGDDTEVVLTHEGFPTDELRDFHWGWESSFDGLVALLERD
jgi:uncharacterized protein YndB with AHSA1/START domain